MERLGWSGCPADRSVPSCLEGAQRREPFLTEAAKLFTMESRKPGQLVLPELGEHQPLPAMVVGVGHPAYKPAGLGAINQLDGRVVTELHPVGDVADCGWLVSFGPSNGQEELVLGRGQTGRPCRFLREIQERPQRTPKLRQSPVLGICYRAPRVPVWVAVAIFVLL